MSLNLALNSALSGIQTSQKGLNLVSRNIANLNTIGYTKKVFNQESRVLGGNGAGVQITEISRRVDYGLIEELNQENATLESLATKADFFNRMQNVFGTPEANSSIAHILAELEEQAEQLALEPNKAEQHLAMVQRADDVSTKLNAMGDLLQELRLDADNEVERSVNVINSLLTDIQTLNEEIAHAVATGNEALDMIDQRDRAVMELTAYMDVTTFTRGTGELVVYTKGGSILVDREARQLTHSSLAAVNAWETYGGDDFQALSIGSHDITDEIGNGKLAALLEMRDTILPGYQSQLDELSQNLRDTVNQVNNRGTSFPNLATEYHGTRTFLDTSNQGIALDANHDVVIALFDADGKQVAQSTLKAEGIVSDSAMTSMDAVAAGLQGWLTAGTTAGGVLSGPPPATVSFVDGKMQVELNNNTYSLVFRDENTGAATPTQEDALIHFDADGSGGTLADADETHSGFAAFLGLNDVYTTNGKNWIWDSATKAENWRPFTAGNLVFSDSTNGLAYGQIGLNGTETIEEIADAINNSNALKDHLEAEVVHENGSVRLRIKQADGVELQITQAGSSTALIDALGLQVSNAGLSNDLAVKDEIQANPSLISRGTMLYNEDTGEYMLSDGDNTTANALAEALAGSTDFDAAGGLPATKRTLNDYAALILSGNSTAAATNENRAEYQTTLVDTLSLKHAEISAVNIDEEIAQLIIFQQSYSAAAKVISTTSDMFDILNSIV